MKNLIPYLRDDEKMENAVIYRGKMTPRVKIHYCRKCKWESSKSRRAALKQRGVSSKNPQFGVIHSSWCD